jgi:hypothetical protein
VLDIVRQDVDGRNSCVPIGCERSVQVVAELPMLPAYGFERIGGDVVGSGTACTRSPVGGPPTDFDVLHRRSNERLHRATAVQLSGGGPGVRAIHRPVGLLAERRLVDDRLTVDEVDDRGDQEARRRLETAIDVRPDRVTRQVHETPDGGLLLHRQPAPRSVGDRAEAVIDGCDLAWRRRGAAHGVEVRRDRQAVVLARRALAARLDREEV